MSSLRPRCRALLPLAFLALAALAAGCETESTDPPGAATLDADGGGAPGLPDARADVATGAPDTPPSPDVPADAGPADTGGADPVCAVVLEPASLNYGVVPRGATKDMTMRLRSVGTGTCGFQGVAVAGCEATTLPGLPACAPGTPTDRFTVVAAPAIAEDGLAPGATADIEVRFTPPAEGEAPALPFLPDTYGGFLQVTLHDPNAPDGADRFRVPADPDEGTDGLAAPNLLARTGDPPALAVLPGQVAFGAVTVGCASAARAVSVHGADNTTVVVTSIALADDCPASFVVEAPPIPAGGLTVTPTAPLRIEVRFLPDAVGPARCDLVVRADAAAPPEVVVALTGEGTLAGSVEDEFAVGGGRPVDVLFVIDDSGSMCEQQDRLGADIGAFLAAADEWGADVRIGVVTTCVQGPDVCDGAGHLRHEALPAADRWFAEGSAELLAAALTVGCSGGSDAQEAGLQAAWMAVSEPIARLTETDCAADDDCADDDVCLPDLGLCGGPNGGFLRAAATLELVFLSDEEDQSLETTAFYEASFRALKAAADPPQLVHAHAIVGDRPDGCGDPNGGPYAQAGSRYIDVAERTGGVVGSICAASFTDTLAAIGALAFGPTLEFPLSREPAPGSVSVSIDGAPCADGWQHDPTTNRVVLAPDGACAPTTGATVRVTYDAACHTL